MEGKAVEELVGTTKADIALAQINVGETELAKRIYGRCGQNFNNGNQPDHFL